MSTQSTSTQAQTKQNFIKSDTIVEATRGSLDPHRVLGEIRIQVAEEQAALKYQRLQAEAQKLGGQGNTMQISVKRIDALVKLAAIEVDFQKARIGRIDVHGEQFKKVMEHFIRTVAEVARATLVDQKVLDLFFNHLETRTSQWEDELAAILE
jgi:hypothetical protein